MKREQALLKNTLIIAFGTILPKFSSIITLPIITAQLTKNEYGVFDLITTLVALFLPVITLQIQTASFRFLIDCEHDEKEKKVIITTISAFVLVVSFFSLNLLFLISYKINVFTRILIILYFEADIFLNVLQQVARGLHMNKLYSLSSVLVSIINMILILLLVQAVNIGLNGVLLSIGIATCVAAIILLYQLKIWQYIDINFFSWERLKELLVYSFPMVPNTLSNWVMNLSDRIVVSLVLGIEANAIYSVANKIPNLFTSVQGTFVLAWQENASIASKDDDIEIYYTKMFDAIFRIFFAIMAWLIALTPVLFVVLIKGDYEHAYFQMPILYIALLFSAVASFIGGIYVAAKQTKSIGLTTIVAAVINLIVNVSLINFIGLFAASLSTLVSYIALAIFRMKNIQKYVGIRYNFPNIILMCMILMIMSLFCFFRNPIFNIINVFLAIVFSIGFNQKYIKNIVRRFDV